MAIPNPYEDRYVYTVDRLLGNAMKLMGEPAKYDKNYSEFAVECANAVIADCWVVNNSMREAAGLEPYDFYPVMKERSEIIPYEFECLQNIMVYGMAFWLLYQDEDNDKASVMNQIYEANKLRWSKAIYTDVIYSN